MNKEQLYKQLTEQQVLLIHELKEKIASTMSMVDIDESDTIDPEDLSHQTESGELKHLFGQKLIKAEKDLELIKKIDFSKKVQAELGALICTDHFNFLIGFAIVPFDFEGKHIVGISMESPIYNEIKGKKINEQFSYSGNTYLINEIY